MNFPFEKATPESLGIPSKSLLRFAEHMDTLDQAHAFVLLRHGKVAASGAWAPYSMDLPHELFSLSKSFVSSAIGIAIGENRIKLTDKVTDFFPEYLTPAVSPEMRSVTLRNLLTMASGHDRCSFSFVDFEHGNWIREIFESPLYYKPGEKFAYNSGATFLLAAVIWKVTGENVRDYLMPRLFEPLGIEKPEWNCNPQGINIGGWGLWLSVKDIAKFSQLLLNGGAWNGKQLIPADYLREATAFQISNEDNGTPDWCIGYGYQFWQCRHNGFRGDGASGQYALVYQKNDLALAFVSGINDMQKLITYFQEDLLPDLSDTPLPENPEIRKLAEQKINSLSVPLPEEMKAACSGSPEKAGTYHIVPGKWNVKELSLAFDKERCDLEIDGMKIRAGFDKYEFSQAALAAKTPHAIAARAAWISPDQLNVYVLCIQTTARFTYRLRFNGNHVAVMRTTPIYFYNPDTSIVFHGTK